MSASVKPLASMIASVTPSGEAGARGDGKAWDSEAAIRSKFWQKHSCRIEPAQLDAPVSSQSAARVTSFGMSSIPAAAC
jgi:hypothetical protein